MEGNVPRRTKMADIPKALRRTLEDENCNRLIDKLREEHVIDLDELCDTTEEMIMYYHNHCPRLEDYRVIEWSPIERTVMRGDRWKDAIKYIDSKK